MIYYWWEILAKLLQIWQDSDRHLSFQWGATHWYSLLRSFFDENNHLDDEQEQQNNTIKNITKITDFTNLWVWALFEDSNTLVRIIFFTTAIYRPIVGGWNDSYRLLGCDHFSFLFHHHGRLKGSTYLWVIENTMVGVGFENKIITRKKEKNLWKKRISLHLSILFISFFSLSITIYKECQSSSVLF